MKRSTMRWLVIALCAFAQPRGIELVETIPVETTLARIAPDAADTWLAMIYQARHSIDLAEFYASNAPGSRLEPIVQALEAAQHRGVRDRGTARAVLSHVVGFSLRESGRPRRPLRTPRIDR